MASDDVRMHRAGFGDAAVFLLIKSNARRNSVELAGKIAKVPGVEEVCFTEGKYSFLARLSAPLETARRLQARLSRCAGVTAVERLDARHVLKVLHRR